MPGTILCTAHGVMMHWQTCYHSLQGYAAGFSLFMPCS